MENNKSKLLNSPCSPRFPILYPWFLLISFICLILRFGPVIQLLDRLFCIIRPGFDLQYVPKASFGQFPVLPILDAEESVRYELGRDILQNFDNFQNYWSKKSSLLKQSRMKSFFDRKIIDSRSVELQILEPFLELVRQVQNNYNDFLRQCLVRVVQESKIKKNIKKNCVFLLKNN